MVLLVSCAAAANAQFGEKNAIYGSNEFNLGGYLGVDLSINYVYDARYSLSLGYSINTRIAKSIPSDYSPGLVGILTLGMNTPHDDFQSFHLAGGIIARLNESGTVRANLSLGVGFVTTTQPYNWVKTDGFMSENYTWDYQKRHYVSFVINPKFEFPFTRHWGLTISPMVQFYEGGTFFVVGVGHIFGLLRGATPVSKPPAELPVE
ncbi:hypothetical protein EG830_07805 [bacterium]|nr:hypothetical protein [bacterium]